MPARVILNPYADRWNARKRWPEAEAALKSTGIDYTVAVSEYKGHDRELASQAAQAGYSPVIAAGGDGTVGQVVNGLARVRGEADLGTIGIMPLGTGNDLVYNLGLPLDLSQAAKVIARGQTRRLDVCKAGEYYFINNSAVGLEPYISVLEKRITLFKGMPRYLAAVLKGIFQNPKWQAEVEWDEGRYEGPVTLVSVGNAPRTGGLFYMTPHANPFDGMLTVLLVEQKSILGLLRLLPKTMSPQGKFIHNRGVREFHTTRLTIRLKTPSFAHCEGEPFPQEIDHLEYSILPGALKVLYD